MITEQNDDGFGGNNTQSHTQSGVATSLSPHLGLKPNTGTEGFFYCCLILASWCVCVCVCHSSLLRSASSRFLVSVSLLFHCFISACVTLSLFLSASFWIHFVWLRVCALDLSVQLLLHFSCLSACVYMCLYVI